MVGWWMVFFLSDNATRTSIKTRWKKFKTFWIVNSFTLIYHLLPDMENPWYHRYHGTAKQRSYSHFSSALFILAARLEGITALMNIVCKFVLLLVWQKLRPKSCELCACVWMRMPHIRFNCISGLLFLVWITKSMDCKQRQEETEHLP